MLNPKCRNQGHSQGASQKFNALRLHPTQWILLAVELRTSPSNDTAQSTPPVNQDNAEAAEPTEHREASQNAPVAEILQVFHVAYLILPILFSYPCLLLCYSLLLSPYFWLTCSSIARPVMAAILNFFPCPFERSISISLNIIKPFPTIFPNFHPYSSRLAYLYLGLPVYATIFYNQNLFGQMSCYSATVFYSVYLGMLQVNSRPACYFSM